MLNKYVCTRYMEPIISQRPHQAFLCRSFDAGMVGQLGDTINRTRGRSSAPDLPMLWSGETTGNKVLRYGTKLADGDLSSTNNGYLKMGGHGRLNSTRWNRTVRDFKTQVGRSFRDIVTPDKSTDVTMRGLPKYTYRLQVSRVLNAKRYRQKFLPLPGKYDVPPGQIPRGGLYPRVTDQVINGESTLYSNGLFNATPYRNISGTSFPAPPPK